MSDEPKITPDIFNEIILTAEERAKVAALRDRWRRDGRRR
jgi:hypothetical protein